MVYLYLHAGSDRGAQLTDALASAMSLRGWAPVWACHHMTSWFSQW